MDYSSDKITLLKESISIYDLFDLSNPRIEYETREIECQINCPFHGNDLNKSARVFPLRSDGTGNSIYCWACAKSWDIIDYWAEINQWWKTDELTKTDSLDIGKAISDLLFKFNLRHQRPDWRTKLDKSIKSISKRKDGFQETPVAEREELKLYYSSRLIKLIEALEGSVRSDSWLVIQGMWDQLDQVDVHDDNWWETLADWGREVKSLQFQESSDMVE